MKKTVRIITNPMPNTVFILIILRIKLRLGNIKRMMLTQEWEEIEEERKKNISKPVKESVDLKHGKEIFSSLTPVTDCPFIHLK
ncbi:CLUMA_CG013714, isoform A [Clunio marinus]|uniref:CLUMA_CG013714, isoform A n=1 Tax=Clunio marinus TaxID=568069 RepID=A0A1J1IJP0_9DIPT|nr:CLUMA_CG013714, isoform A [Clunio marinus]